MKRKMLIWENGDDLAAKDRKDRKEGKNLRRRMVSRGGAEALRWLMVDG
jgi:hypothetical protein